MYHSYQFISLHLHNAYSNMTNHVIWDCSHKMGIERGPINYSSYWNLTGIHYEYNESS